MIYNLLTQVSKAIFLNVSRLGISGFLFLYMKDISKRVATSPGLLIQLNTTWYYIDPIHLHRISNF